ncbi:MAG: ATP-binding cassette domain-containing protein [Alphaproteobacteria bacterium]|nr:ATP-binding cassette domain-containing protein [Alphaproteobacteria bacterium]
MTKEIITVKDLIVAYDDFVLFDDINFSVNEKDIFIIMGASGCGKSSMLRVLTGLVTPIKGDVLIDGKEFLRADTEVKNNIMKECGVMYQSGALFSSMTLKQNIALPLELYSDYSDKEINEIASYKLALTGLGGFDDFYPSEISGGMKKRAALSRALALDPKIVYCDEPSAGLDPISSKRLDDLIIELNQSLGTTFVVVTHELQSIFNIGTNSIFLDGSVKNITGRGNPKELLKNPPNENIYEFLTRGNNNGKTA